MWCSLAVESCSACAWGTLTAAPSCLARCDWYPGLRWILFTNSRPQLSDMGMYHEDSKFSQLTLFLCLKMLGSGLAQVTESETQRSRNGNSFCSNWSGLQKIIWLYNPEKELQVSFYGLEWHAGQKVHLRLKVLLVSQCLGMRLLSWCYKIYGSSGILTWALTRGFTTPQRLSV